MLKYPEMTLDLYNSSDNININSEGIVLSLNTYGDKNIYAGLFLMDYGRVNASLQHYSPMKKNTSRELQQFSWARFEIIQNKRTRNYYIKDLNIISDSSRINMNRDALHTALRWSEIVKKYLIPKQADNELLNNLRDNMKLLESPGIVPVHAADFRFIWLWLEEWGLAPDLITFYGSKNFNDDEIVLLTQIQRLNSDSVIKLLSYHVSKNIRKNALRIASDLALNFFNQK